MNDGIDQKVTILSGHLRVDGLQRDVAVATLTPVLRGTAAVSGVGSDASGAGAAHLVAPVVAVETGALADVPSATPLGGTGEVSVSAIATERGLGGSFESRTSSMPAGEATLSIDRVPLPAGAALAVYAAEPG